MKNVKTVFLKEIRRVFTDYRMLMGLFLPGMLIFVIYTIMGKSMNSIENAVMPPPTNQEIRIAFTDNSGSETPRIVQGLVLELEGVNHNKVIQSVISKDDLDDAKESLKKEELHLVIQFSDDFENQYNTEENKGFNYISFYYNAEDVASSYIYNLANSLLDVFYQNYSVNIVDGVPIVPNVAEGDAVYSTILSFVFPIVTISLLFSAVLSICPESIAGEKERGTLSSVLLTPAKRSHIVMGKIFALAVTGLASGSVSFLGLFFSLPSLMQSNAGMGIGWKEGIMLFFSIVTLLLLFISFATLISTFCKSVKEATNYLSPFMFVFMLFAIAAMFVDVSSIGYAFAPVLNVVSLINMLITGEGMMIPTFFALTLLSNIVYISFFVFVTAKLFTKEKIMITQ